MSLVLYLRSMVKLEKKKDIFIVAELTDHNFFGLGVVPHTMDASDLLQSYQPSLDQCCFEQIHC